jgi:hypothetical protein
MYDVFSPHDQPETDSPQCVSKAPLEPSTAVRFSVWEDIYYVPNARDMTFEELEATWYASTEYEKFMEHCERTVELMEQGECLKEENRSTLGLEHWTKAGYKRRQRRKFAGLESVLNEQWAQWHDGIDDLDSVAQLYEASSTHAKMIATTTGLQLEREVRAYLADILDECESVLASSIGSAAAKYSKSSSMKSKSPVQKKNFDGKGSNHSRSAVIDKTPGSTQSRRTGDSKNSASNSSTHSRGSVGSSKSSAGKKTTTMANSSTHSRSSVASKGSIHSRSSVSSSGSTTSVKTKDSVEVSKSRTKKLKGEGSIIGKGSSHSHSSTTSKDSLTKKSSQAAKDSTSSKAPKKVNELKPLKAPKKKVASKESKPSEVAKNDTNKASSETSKPRVKVSLMTRIHGLSKE